MTPCSPRRFSRAFIALGATLLLCATTLVLGTLPAGAAQAPVGLGTAGSFAVLGGSAVTNTGPSVLTGNLGVSPDTAISGFPPGKVSGTIHRADAVAAKAQADTTTAYNDAAGRKPFTAVATELAGRTLQPGVYRHTTLGLTGRLTLDAGGDPAAVFVFQAGSTLTTGSGSEVLMINGAQACNVFWQVGSSATLGKTTKFVGTVLALTSITVDKDATVKGRLLARNGAVTLIDDTVAVSACDIPTTTTTPTTTAPTTAPTTVPLSTESTTAAPAELAATADATATGDGTATTAAAATTGSELRRSSDGGEATPTPPLARTGSVLTIIAMAGALAILLGVFLVRGARPGLHSRRY